MFGLLSSPKILLLLLVVGAVVWFFRRQPRNDRANTGDSTGETRSKSTARKAESPSKTRPIEDMVPCPKCGAYVAKNAAHDCAKVESGR